VKSKKQQTEEEYNVEGEEEKREEQDVNVSSGESEGDGGGGIRGEEGGGGGEEKERELRKNKVGTKKQGFMYDLNGKRIAKEKQLESTINEIETGMRQPKLFLGGTQIVSKESPFAGQTEAVPLIETVGVIKTRGFGKRVTDGEVCVRVCVCVDIYKYIYIVCKYMFEKKKKR
jgi:hypothetical protein